MYRSKSSARRLLVVFIASLVGQSCGVNTSGNFPFANGTIVEWFFPVVVKRIELAILNSTDKNTDDIGQKIGGSSNESNGESIDTTPLLPDWLPTERTEIFPPPDIFEQFFEQNTFATLESQTLYPIVPDIIGGHLLLDSLVKLNNYICGENAVCDQKHDQYGCRIAQCFPCQCDKECWRYSDCCPDILTNSTLPPADPDYTCVSQGYKDAKTQPPRSYLMIGHCPRQELSPNLKENLRPLCETPNRRNVLEFTPVYSAFTGLHYQNQFCAMCWEVPEFEPWSIHPFCTAYVDYNNMISLDDFQDFVQNQRTCGIYAYPPDIGTVRRCYFNETMVTQCNVTGLWEVRSYKYDIELGCSLFTQPVVVRGVLYKNTVCAICNGATVLRQSNCPNYQDGDIVAPFSVLLNFREKDTILKRHFKMDKQVECEDTEILDPYNNLCRKLYCPVGKYSQNHTCNNMFDSAKGVGYILNYSLKPKNKQYAVIKDNIHMAMNRFMYAYTNSLRTAIGLSWYKIIVKCSYHREVSAFGTFTHYVKSMVVQFAILVQRHIPRTQVERSLVAFVKSGYFYYNLGDVTPELFVAEWLTAEEHIDFDNGISTVYANTSGRLHSEMIVRTFIEMKMLFHDHPEIPEEFFHNTSAYIQVNEIMNCNHIELNSSEYYLKENGTVFIKLAGMETVLYPGQYKAIGKRVRVCVNFETTKQTVPDGQSESGVFDAAEMIMTIICTSLSLVGLVVTLMVYVIYPSLQSFPGKLNMALWTNLFIAQLLWVSLATVKVQMEFCLLFGIAIHYFWLSTFSWKLVSGFHLYRTFHNPFKVLEEKKSLTKYILFSQIFPFVIIGVYILIHYYTSGQSDIGYAGRVIGLDQRLCFLSGVFGIGLAFALPVSLVILINAFFFASFVQSLRDRPNIATHTSKSDVKQRVLFVKLSFLLGFSWILGFIALASGAQVMWYMFTILNSSLGVFIFISFGMNKLCSCYSPLPSGTLTTGNSLPNKAYTSRNTESINSDPVKVYSDTKPPDCRRIPTDVIADDKKKALTNGFAEDTML